MAANPQRVLLIEPNLDLRELEELVLSGAGYEVQPLPPRADPVSYVKRTRPDVVIMSISPSQPQAWEHLDRLAADSDTQSIPVVVISTIEQTVAEAQTLPVVRYTLIAPYDIEALETAVATALRHPPPSAVLPPARVPVAEISALVADEIDHRYRAIVLATIRELRENEAYRTRFPELSRGLVNELGQLVATVTNGLRRHLAPSETFSESEIRRIVSQHVRLRVEQGLGLSTAIHEQQTLRGQLESVLPDLVGRDGVTCQDLLGVSRRMREHVDYLIRTIIHDYASMR